MPMALSLCLRFSLSVSTLFDFISTEKLQRLAIALRRKRRLGSCVLITKVLPRTASELSRNSSMGRVELTRCLPQTLGVHRKVSAAPIATGDSTSSVSQSEGRSMRT